MRVTWGGMKTSEADEGDGPEPGPSSAPRMPARELRPAEGARSAEDREDGGRPEQVATEDRQAGRGEDAEGDDRDHPGHGAQSDARSQERERQHPAARGAEEHGLSEDLAQPARHGARDLVEAGDALQALRGVARAGERVQRVAGDDEVAECPQQRRGGGERPQPGVAHAADPQPDEVGAREQPRLGPDEAGEAEQRQDGRARAAVPGLDEEGAEDEGQVRNVDVGARAEVEHGTAREDDRRRQRAGGAVDPLLAEAVRDPAQRPQEDEGQDDGRRRWRPGRRGRRGPRRPAWRAGGAWGRARRRSRGASRA